MAECQRVLGRIESFVRRAFPMVRTVQNTRDGVKVAVREQRSSKVEQRKSSPRCERVSEE